MHARAGSRGFLAHTYTLEPSFHVDGVDITESRARRAMEKFLAGASTSSRWCQPTG
jgi:hypothetical protein